MTKLAKLSKFELKLIEDFIPGCGQVFHDRLEKMIEDDIPYSFSLVCGIDIAEYQEDKELDEYYMKHQNDDFGLAFLVEKDLIGYNTLFLSRQFRSKKWTIHLNKDLVSTFDNFEEALKAFQKESDNFVK
jgi:hypothetical protein